MYEYHSLFFVMIKNLNLLRAFDAVMRERKVSRAAEELGLTQPALSNAIAKLRLELGDALFVRSGNGVEPTPFAQEYHLSVARALVLLDAASTQARAFDPERDKRRFTIAMSGIAESVVLPRIVAQNFRDRANLSIVTRPIPRSDLAGVLGRGNIDLTIGFIQRSDGPLIRQLLFTTNYVLLAPQDYSLGPAPRFVVVEGKGTGHEVVAAGIRQAFGDSAVALRMPDFLAVPHAVRAAGIPAIVPLPVALIYARWLGLRLADVPIGVPEIEIFSYAHERMRSDGANRWLRNACQRTFADVDWAQPIG
ncbi:LysR family transcriptional regulator [Parasphingopyxis algicola]|uniref:LysR family transcriptional regulator n=1 Tax=Parasphingopyxis algicola TaxID=2026624 RepID=UPI0015A2288B|nr:LysR family transcriptional regulator [Parasphingopyxis algicola]QLC23913.1 LysR family transcriptional regulator [Parasphingopyxis algicola]